MKKTLILGATTNPDRYAYAAAQLLTRYGHPIVPVGVKAGEVFGQPILTEKKPLPEAQIHTLTLYVGVKNQPEWYDFILKTKPKRLIFNPGTENPELAKLAKQAGIETENACTLVLLNLGQF
jgi:predicted CoA-binding protein